LSQTSWRQQLASVPATFAPAASPAVLATVERALGIELPEELRSFLSESDGLKDRYKFSVVWPASEIAEQNRVFRTNPDFRDLYMPFDPLLFFGAAGNGDQFFYRILNDAVRDFDIYIWDHETDGRIWRAPRLGRFLNEVLAEPADG
jgi:hypothetical protein